MTLKEYFSHLPRGAKSEMATKIGVSSTWISLIISKKKTPSAQLCLDIEKATRRMVKRKELRPDLFNI